MSRKQKNLTAAATLETVEPAANFKPETIKSETIKSSFGEPLENSIAANSIAPKNGKLIANLIFQAWLGVAIWMSFGLLMEGFIGYRIPSYFADATRRELFRLAHAHGALLSVLLFAAAFCADKSPNPPNFAIWSLRAGVVLMPLGFLLAGVWHFPDEPGIAIWLVPIAALLIVFAAITLALASYKK